ncbi:MAG: hypothetical protein IJ686_04535 [Bacteroidales bacterium]|nr:hypothetical protein [Bacteroidales bacterium]
MAPEKGGDPRSGRRPWRVSRVADKKAPGGWKLHVQQLTDSQQAEVDLRLKALEPYMAIPLT